MKPPEPCPRGNSGVRGYRPTMNLFLENLLSLPALLLNFEINLQDCVRLSFSEMPISKHFLWSEKKSHDICSACFGLRRYSLYSFFDFNFLFKLPQRNEEVKSTWVFSQSYSSTATYRCLFFEIYVPSIYVHMYRPYMSIYVPSIYVHICTVHICPYMYRWRW